MMGSNSVQRRTMRYLAHLELTILKRSAVAS